MSHGTAAPAPGTAAGNGHPGPGGLPASRGLPSPGSVPADDGRPGSAPPAVRVRGVRRSFEAELALLAANLLAAWPGHRAARLRSAQILRTE